MHPYVYSNVIYNNQIMEEAEVSTEWWMDKEDTWCVCVCMYIYNGTLLSPKKNEILLCETTWMELESIMLSEISQSEKDKYHMISLICRI